MIPFLENLKAHYGELDDPCGCICDGECEQISPFFTPNLIEKFKTMKCVLGKLAASTTAVGQPCDAWKMFSTLHHCFDICTRQDAFAQISLKRAVVNMLKKHEEMMNRSMKSDLKARITMALLKAKIAVERAFTHSNFGHSWEICGIDQDLTGDFLKIFQQYKIKDLT